jgi:sterol desaturase/sphingolipid hydroxylase (fatty acid hydroxylase superfamily)
MEPATPAERIDRPNIVAVLAAAGLLVMGIALHSTLLIAFIVLFCVFTPLEKLFALRPQRVFRRGFGTDLVHFAVTNVLIGVLFIGLLIPAIILVRHGGVLPTARVIHAEPLWAQIVEAQLMAEFTHYWAHRATHRIGILWRFHKMHHSIEQLDWLASARQHPLDGAITRGLAIAPLFLLGFSNVAFGAAITIQTVEALFQHSNIRIRLGPVKWLIASPEFHHWHHSNDPVARDKNFAGGLPILDLIFGTAYLPGWWPAGYGVAEEIPQSGYVKQLAYPLRASQRAGQRVP